MTLEDGSSLSQAEVHLDIFNRVVKSRMEMVANVVNWQLLPRLQAMGLPYSDDDEFAWDEAVNYTPEQQLAIEQMLINAFDIDPKYFAEKYNVTILGAKRSPLIPGIAELKKKSPDIAELDRVYGLKIPPGDM